MTKAQNLDLSKKENIINVCLPIAVEYITEKLKTCWFMTLSFTTDS